MKKGTLLALLTGVALMSISGLSSTDIGRASSANAQGKKAPSSDIPVSISFRDAGTDMVTSDSVGSYVNGVAGVSAVINGIGNLIVDSNTASGTAVRTFKFNFSSPTADNTSPISPNSLQPLDGATIATRIIGIPMQNMVIGTYQCVELAFGFREGTLQYTLAFITARAYPGDEVTGTSYALVTRTSADTWEVEPVAPCLDVPTVGKLHTSTTRGKTTYTSYGKYYLPFKLTVTRQ
jgi:hypothetical protein